MIAKIKQHPEWKIVEDWFNGRALKAGVNPFHHIERIAIDVTIDELVEQCAKELAYQVGLKVSELCTQ